MIVRFFKKSGHRFFDIDYNGLKRSLCVDGWLNPSVCPSFCHPKLTNGWEPLSNSGVVTVFESVSNFTLVCPTSLGYVSKRGLYRTAGAYHVEFILDKTGFFQFLYNSTIGG